MAQKLDELVAKRKEQLDNFFLGDLAKDETLTEQLTLGSKWDDPFHLTQAMDKQPERYSQWAFMKRRAEKTLIIEQQKFKAFEAKMMEFLWDEIYEYNKSQKMTATSARPTAKELETRFTYTYSEEFIGRMNEDERDFYEVEMYLAFKERLSELEDIAAEMKIITKAFEMRPAMLSSMGTLVKCMIDNDILIKRKMNQRKG